MHQSIWSAPQVGGSGGALKALARNVANHLKLNRCNMKRVVAQVVAEHHTLGEVADYKGHMYFAKPDRLNFHELIAQSKEAFDDLLLHEPRSLKKQAIKQRSKYTANPNVKLQMKVSPPQLAMPPKKPSIIRKAGLPKKQSRPKIRSRKKSSTTIFQLADAGRRSLNGVIIDETHLPQDGEQREILLHVPPSLVKRSRKRLRPVPTKDTAEKAAKDTDPGKTEPQKDGGKIAEEKVLQVQKRQPEKKRCQEQKPKPRPVRKLQENHQKELTRPRSGSPARQRAVSPSRHQAGSPSGHQAGSPSRHQAGSPSRHQAGSPSGHRLGSPARPRSGSPSAPQTRRSPSPLRSQKVSPVQKTMQPLRTKSSHKTVNVKSQLWHQRIRAGATKVATAKPAEKPEKVEKNKSRSKLRTLRKSPQRSYEKPWIVKRSNKKARLLGGSQLKLKKTPQRTNNIEAKRKEKSGKEGKVEQSAARSTKVDTARNFGQLKAKRSSHVGRQMRKVNFPWYTPYQFQGAAGATQIPNAGVGVPPCQLLKEKSRKLIQRLAVSQPVSPMKRPNLTSRQRHNLRLQERLIRDLQREEAIDDPLSHGSGVFRRARGGWQPSQQPKKEQDQQHQQVQQHQQNQQHQQHQQVQQHQQFQQDQQDQQDLRSVERVSSRIKRLPKGRRYRQPIATSERIMIPNIPPPPPPKLNNNNNNNNNDGNPNRLKSPSRGNAMPRVRRRCRSVPVDSSLGSIALMGQPVPSKQTLTPAKRHLTIAFMNKRSERANAAIQPWK